MNGIRSGHVPLLLASCLLVSGGCGGETGSPASVIEVQSVKSGNDAGAGQGTTAVEGGTAKLTWEAPLAEAGGYYADLAGYRVHYGISSGSYTNSFDAGPETACTITGLFPGTYYLAVTAYDSVGGESEFSNEVIKTIP